MDNGKIGNVPGVVVIDPFQDGLITTYIFKMDIREIDPVADPVVAESRVDEYRIFIESVRRVAFSSGVVRAVTAYIYAYNLVFIDEKIVVESVGRGKYEILSGYVGKIQ